MSDLQRKVFKHLKENLIDPCTFDNFEIYLNTRDMQEVKLYGLIGDDYWSIKYERESYFFFLWTPWECTITMGDKIHKEEVIDKSVIKDIVDFEKEVIKQAEIREETKACEDFKDIVKALEEE